MVYGQLHHRVALGAACERPAIRRGEVVDRGPGEREGHEHDARHGEVGNAPSPPQRRTQGIDQREGRQHHEGGKHLDVEPHADQRGGQQQEPPAPSLRGHEKRPGGEEEDEHEAALGIVRAVRGHAHRHDREEKPREQSGPRAEAPPDEIVQERHRRHAFHHLGQEHGEPVKAEEFDGQGLEPQRHRRLVDRDEARRIEGVVEEGAADRGGVVLVVVAVLIQAPQPQGGGEDEDGGASYLDGHVSPDPSTEDDCATLATQLNGHRRPAGSITTWRRTPACDV